jgi:hypothetical protein
MVHGIGRGTRPNLSTKTRLVIGHIIAASSLLVVPFGGKIVCVGSLALFCSNRRNDAGGLYG